MGLTRCVSIPSIKLWHLTVPGRLPCGHRACPSRTLHRHYSVAYKVFHIQPSFPAALLQHPSSRIHHAEFRIAFSPPSRTPRTPSDPFPQGLQPSRTNDRMPNFKFPSSHPSRPSVRLVFLVFSVLVCMRQLSSLPNRVSGFPFNHAPSSSVRVSSVRVFLIL